MAFTLPLDQMTTSEKLLTMESLWDDLCRKADQVPSPSWHGDVLNQRVKNVKNGSVEFIEWNEAKRKIRDSVK